MPNPLLSRITPDAFPKEILEARDMLLQRAGEADVLEVMMNNPAITDWFFNDFYGQLFYNGNQKMLVDVKTKELMRLRMALLHGCLVCRTVDTIDAQNAGVKQEQIDNLANPTSEHFDERELALIELVDQMNFKNPDGEMSEDLYNRLSKYYSDQELVELGLLFGVIAGAVKFFFVYNLVTKEGSCPIISKT